MKKTGKQPPTTTRLRILRMPVAPNLNPDQEAIELALAELGPDVPLRKIVTRAKLLKRAIIRSRARSEEEQPC